MILHEEKGNIIQNFDYSNNIIYKHLYINDRTGEQRYDVEFVNSAELLPEFEPNIFKCSAYGDYCFFVTQDNAIKDLFVNKLKAINNKIINDAIHFVSYSVINYKDFGYGTKDKSLYKLLNTNTPIYTVQFDIVNYKPLMWRVYNNE